MFDQDPTWDTCLTMLSCIQVMLSRYDLFHAHIFAAHGSNNLVRLQPFGNVDSFGRHWKWCEA